MGAALAAASGSRYGAGSVAFDAVTGAVCIGAITKGIKFWKAGRAAARAASAADEVAEAGGTTRRIFSARVLDRMATDPGPFHNFPQSIGDDVFAKGQRSVISADYVQYTRRGTVNGVEGTYEIGVRPSASGRNETITHWFFRPNKQ